MTEAAVSCQDFGGCDTNLTSAFQISLASPSRGASPTHGAPNVMDSRANHAPSIPWLQGSRPPRIAVVGDVILDEYLDGQVNRISPEAPVPVHLVTKTIHGAGGAANAARNIKLAGGDVMLLSVIGNDEAGKNLRQLLQRDQIDTSYMQSVNDRPTIRKTRITSSSHQLVRVDWERVHPISTEVQDWIMKGLRSIEFDALLISDYGKGALPISLLSNLLGLAAERKVPAVVDPKGRDFSKYLHATLITPNRKEACDALGLDPSDDYSGEELGRRLQSTFGLQNVLVTMGPKGMVLVPDTVKGAPSKTLSLPAMAREVYDVSGAGDTVVAIMTLCLAAKAPMIDAMHIANTAAALVVAKWGTQPVRLDELKGALSDQPEAKPSGASFTTSTKITTREALKQQLEAPARRQKKIVFTNGCFDILHAGHVTYLEAAKSLGDVLVVGVNTDESVRQLKGTERPIIGLADRMRLLSALASVDFVVPFGESTPLDLITSLAPDVLVKGADYDKSAPSSSSKSIVGADFVQASGGTVETITLVPGLSTSVIVERIRSL